MTLDTWEKEEQNTKVQTSFFLEDITKTFHRCGVRPLIFFNPCRNNGFFIIVSRVSFDTNDKLICKWSLPHDDWQRSAKLRPSCTSVEGKLSFRTGNFVLLCNFNWTLVCFFFNFTCLVFHLFIFFSCFVFHSFCFVCLIYLFFYSIL